jgi:ribosomal protein S19E (S16A)
MEMSDNIKHNDNTNQGHNPVSDAVDAIGRKILEELDKHGMSPPDNERRAAEASGKKELPMQADRFLPTLEIHH